MLIASHRGPVTPVRRDGAVEYLTATGGLVNTLRPAMQDPGTVWLSSASTAPDRHPAGGPDADLARLPFVVIEPALHRRYYDVVANGVLWPLFHHDPRDPAGAATAVVAGPADWDAYRAVNLRFAERLAALARTGDTVVVHDYHLMLVPAMLAALRPDLRVAYFHHIPFVEPEQLDALPATVVRSLLSSLNQVPVGFQSPRWQQQFERCCARHLVSRQAFSVVAPVVTDVGLLAGQEGSPQVARARAELRRFAGDRMLIGRVDRADPVKNLHRGLAAIDVLLTRESRWIDRMTMVSHLVPTRQSVPGYAAYSASLSTAVDELNRKWATGCWTPVRAQFADDHARAVAILMEYDVLLVNPVREGMNLVAQEGPLLNQRDGVLVLSDGAGAQDILHEGAVSVPALDVEATAAGISAALGMPAAERRERHRWLRRRVTDLAATPWQNRLLDAFGSAAG